MANPIDELLGGGTATAGGTPPPNPIDEIIRQSQRATTQTGNPIDDLVGKLAQPHGGHTGLTIDQPEAKTEPPSAADAYANLPESPEKDLAIATAKAKEFFGGVGQGAKSLAKGAAQIVGAHRTVGPNGELGEWQTGPEAEQLIQGTKDIAKGAYRYMTSSPAKDIALAKALADQATGKNVGPLPPELEQYRRDMLAAGSIGAGALSGGTASVPLRYAALSAAGAATSPDQPGTGAVLGVAIPAAFSLAGKALGGRGAQASEAPTPAEVEAAAPAVEGRTISPEEAAARTATSEQRFAAYLNERRAEPRPPGAGTTYDDIVNAIQREGEKRVREMFPPEEVDRVLAQRRANAAALGGPVIGPDNLPVGMFPKEGEPTPTTLPAPSVAPEALNAQLAARWLPGEEPPTLNEQLARRWLPGEQEPAPPAESVARPEPVTPTGPEPLLNPRTQAAPAGTEAVQAETMARAPVKEHLTFGEQRQAFEDFARENGIDPLTMDPRAMSGINRYSGPQIMAMREQMNTNWAQAAEIDKALADSTLTADKAMALEQTRGALMDRNDALLRGVVREQGELGRNLGYLRQLAAHSLDPDVWAVNAQRLAGDVRIPDEVIADIRRLAREAAALCGGG